MLGSQERRIVRSRGAHLHRIENEQLCAIIGLFMYVLHRDSVVE